MLHWDKKNGGSHLDYSKIKILYEDNHLLVCIKPAGVLSQASDKNLPDMLTLLKAYLKEKYMKPGNVFLGLVHRLDLNVGGIMVFAKTSKAAARLSEVIRNHEFTKEYYAVVKGALPIGQEETLLDKISKNELNRVGYIDDDFGKESKLHYSVLDSQEIKGEKYSLVQIRLFSGRFHQIRVQFSSRGFPLFGDEKYGNDNSSIENEIGLYAYKVSFPHPVSKQIIEFEDTPFFGIFSQFFS